MFYDQKSVLGARLFDALKNSPEFSEDLGGGYIAPGTRYVSSDKKISVEKGSGGISLKISMTGSDRGSMVSGPSSLIVGFVGGQDIGSVLHQALLTSRSSYVLTKDRPSKEIKPRGDEAVVLSEVSFSGEYVSCGTFLDGARGRCSFTLNR